MNLTRPTRLLQLMTVPALVTGFCTARAQSPSPTPKSDAWGPLRTFIGQWQGEVKGEPGEGKAERTYSFALNERFIQINNTSI